MSTYAFSAASAVDVKEFSQVKMIEKTLINQGVPKVRLTARGRFLMRVVTLLSLMVLMMSAYSAFAGGEVDPGKSHVEVLVIAPGENLWTIAGLLGGDRNETVARIMELNALTEAKVSAGDRIIIPTRHR